MPLGLLRLNERHARPNQNINHITPLSSTTPAEQARAQHFLNRIAAQCQPIMKQHHLYVNSLEEFPSNREFLGRNFNAGECIQLVLRNKNGGWLPFRFVQMVMMHEISHNVEMNHSRAFWKVRNGFAEEMKGLWAKGYQGEGVWGRGRELERGGFEGGDVPSMEEVPEHLCGGSYRRARRGRKRKRGADDVGAAEQKKETYAERQQKRIKRKFGKHGEGHDLGEDQLVRGALESQHRAGKPRVANSKRGRELRANAALARFGALAAQKRREETQPGAVSVVDSDTESDVGSGSELERDIDYNDFNDGKASVDMIGHIKDSKGGDLYKVCEEGDAGEQGGQEEMDELRMMGVQGLNASSRDTGNTRHKFGKDDAIAIHDDSETESETDAVLLAFESTHKTNVRTGCEHDAEQGTEIARAAKPSGGPNTLNSHISVTLSKSKPPAKAIRNNNKSATSSPYQDALKQSPIDTTAPLQPQTSPPAPTELHTITTTTTTTNTHPSSWTLPSDTASNTCQICSLQNSSSAPLCQACSHVLQPSLLRETWRCNSEQCKGSLYINAGDAGRCGICGALKPALAAKESNRLAGERNERGWGVVGGDVLRWD